jgi:hypothetical protein
MKFTKLKIKLSIALLTTVVGASKIHGQSNSDISIYKWFDTEVGEENLDINNGTFHSNPYNTIGQNSMYYIDDQYEFGSLRYEGQNYYNVKLKYDVFRDELILNPYGESEYIGIILIQDKIQSFLIKGKSFVKIEQKDYQSPELVTGYYEKNKIGTDLILYIKHHKNITKNINNNGLSYKFREDNLFFLDYKNTAHIINSKNDIIKLFPKQKKQIKVFYSTNRKIRKSDLNQFMENLIRNINNSLSLQTK